MGRAYDRLEESLHRWKGVSIHYKSAWRDNSRGQWCDSEALGVIEYVKLTDSRRKSAGVESDRRSRIIWNKILFDSFASGYLKRLDYQTYRSLERPAARRAYRFLDKRFFHKPTWEFELRTFACEKIGLSRSYDTGQLKQRLQPALGELERIGFIAPVQYRKQRPKVWQIAISKAPVDSEATTSETSAPPLVGELVKRGIAAAAAQVIVAEYSESVIREKLKFFDWLVTRQDRRVAKNPPGFLMAAIRRDYRPPKDFAPVATKRKSPSCSPADGLPASHRPQPLSTEQQAIWDSLCKLSGESQQAIEQQAVAAASRIESDIYRRLAEKGGRLWDEFRQSLLIGYVSRNAKLLSAATVPSVKAVAKT